MAKKKKPPLISQPALGDFLLVHVPYDITQRIHHASFATLARYGSEKNSMRAGPNTFALTMCV
jgi:hypothetical protein